MNEKTLFSAILALQPYAIFTMSDANDYSTIDWESDDITQPTLAEAEAKKAELNSDIQKLRIIRNIKLADTDWWASSDLTMTAEQTAYRQALRDITNTYTSLDDVVWPDIPA